MPGMGRQVIVIGKRRIGRQWRSFLADRSIQTGDTAPGASAFAGRLGADGAAVVSAVMGSIEEGGERFGRRGVGGEQFQ